MTHTVWDASNWFVDSTKPYGFNAVGLFSSSSPVGGTIVTGPIPYQGSVPLYIRGAFAQVGPDGYADFHFVSTGLTAANSPVVPAIGGNYQTAAVVFGAN